MFYHEHPPALFENDCGESDKLVIIFRIAQYLTLEIRNCSFKKSLAERQRS